MNRCIQLAMLAGKKVGANPNVGAILVHNDRIIGEGYYKEYGGPHAEVNCINNVHPSDSHLIADSTLYVSLEPCCIYGKTPPCTDAIVHAGIKTVVVGTSDPNPSMSGKSFSLLKKAGIQVIPYILEKEAKAIIRPFSTWILEERPYIILKLVKSIDNYLSIRGNQTWLSNEFSGVLTHKWRSECHGILVGSETVLVDNPSLTTRNYPGTDPVRIIVDRRGRLDKTRKVFHDENYLYIGTSKTIKSRTSHVTPDYSVTDIIGLLNTQKIYRLMVEGGAKMLKSFIENGLWDEARIITTPHKLHEGVKAPNIHGRITRKMVLKNDIIHWIYR